MTYKFGVKVGLEGLVLECCVIVCLVFLVFDFWFVECDCFWEFFFVDVEEFVINKLELFCCLSVIKFNDDDE